MILRPIFRVLHVALLVGGLSACDPFHTGFDEVEAALLLEAAEKVPAGATDGELRVMTWNIRFGVGRTKLKWDCGGEGVLVDGAEVERNLAAITARIREEDPDIVFVQEVDRLSKRSGYVDEMQLLLDDTDLNYAAWISTWRADFVPSDGIGRLDHGQAILSRWPIDHALRFALPQVTTRPPWELYFHLHRALLEARVHVEGRAPLHLVHFHADAEDPAIRKAQIDIFEARLRSLDEAGAAVLGGGDLNSIPPGSPVWSDFVDERCDEGEGYFTDHRGEEEWLDGLYAGFEAAIDLETFAASPEDYMTFGANEELPPSRKLDYLFSNRPLRDGLVLQDERTGSPTTSLSDHKPLVVTVELP
jgi:endonuclease/exonuclease/phosphatase family metal-dependent hydrolase